MHLSLEKCIIECVQSLNLDLDERRADSPMSEDIPHGSPLLGPEQRRKYLTLVGCIGWCALLVFAPLSLAHSRLARFLSAPTRASHSAATKVLKWLKQHKHYMLPAPLTGYDKLADDDELYPLQANSPIKHFSDTAWSSSAIPNIQRRSQQGHFAVVAGWTPVAWHSTIASSGFAHQLMGEARVAQSSAEAELYEAVSALNGILNASYAHRELGRKPAWETPFTLAIDNEARRAWLSRATQRSKLRHIDAKLCFLRQARDKSLLRHIHIKSVNNLADVHTKPTDKCTFSRFFHQVMRPLHRKDTEQKNETSANQLGTKKSQ